MVKTLYRHSIADNSNRINSDESCRVRNGTTPFTRKDSQSRELRRGDGFERVPKFEGTASLHFDEREQAFPLSDEVNLALSAPPAAVDNPIALGDEVLGCDRFAPLPQNILVCHMHMVEQLTPAHNCGGTIGGKLCPESCCEEPKRRLLRDREEA